MLHYDRIEVLEGIDVNKTNASKECNICHYWYFLSYSFKFLPKFQPNFISRCHDLLMMSINLSNIAISNFKGSDCRFFISLISKNKTVTLIQNAALTEKSRTL